MMKISSVLKEQPENFSHVENIAQMTDKNSAAARETAASTQHLDQIASELSETIGRFKV